jgi:hypothetical protein
VHRSLWSYHIQVSFCFSCEVQAKLEIHQNV